MCQIHKYINNISINIMNNINELTPDRNLLSNRKSYSKISPPIIKSEVEQTIRSIKKGKVAGVDNIPGELFTHGGDEMLTVMITLCLQIWKTQEWPDM